MSRVIVVGGGPAGMMAALAAAESGCEVTLYEQNEKLGKKLFITGKGRCNLTNACDTEDLFKNITRNSKFLYSAIYSYDNFRVMDFFESQGMKIKIERGNRVFPASDHSSDVIAALRRALEQSGVHIELNTRDTASPDRKGGDCGRKKNRGHFSGGRQAGTGRCGDSGNGRLFLFLYRLHRRWISVCRGSGAFHSGVPSLTGPFYGKGRLCPQIDGAFA